MKVTSLATASRGQMTPPATWARPALGCVWGCAAVLGSVASSGCVDTGSQPSASLTEAPVVYGADDRADVYETGPRFAALARASAVALIVPEHLVESDERSYRIEAPRLDESLGLCEGERFADQPAAAGCSGVLIAPDLVATSAHCLPRAPGGCGPSRYVFGYLVERQDEPLLIAREDVYDCAAVEAHLSSTNDEICRWGVAVVRLDRVVDPARHTPARMRDTPAQNGEALGVIGFPTGLPAKVDLGAHVLDARPHEGDYFTLDSDTFAVSSGSGVFDSEGALLGILARGTRDFDDSAGCLRVNTLPSATASSFEEATPVGGIQRALASRLTDLDAATCEDAASCDLSKCERSSEEPSGVLADSTQTSPAARSASCAIPPNLAPAAQWDSLRSVFWTVATISVVRTVRRRRHWSQRA